MNGIQILLIAAVIVTMFFYIVRLRSAIFDLIILTVFSGLAIFFILFPEYTNDIARKMGVGRGADLLFYICIFFFIFIIMKMFARIRRLETTLTEIVRQQALKEADSANKEVGK
ncbi:hypothetical protein CAP36_13510 [Chitinophagaceae bacterium IBVUCB2]|nr:hypothetical protein CAP36_13510 [Chitinophagaceae bacterium IBVUCB2]